jgi:hypothetical protein
MSILMVFVFLPGTWIAYGVSRWALSHFDLSMSDQIALSFLAGIVYLVGHLVVAWDLKNGKT